MKHINQKQVLPIAVFFFAVIAVSIFIIIRIGSAYSRGLEEFRELQVGDPVTHTVKEDIKRIIIKKSDSAGCYELRPDGTIRTYAECDDAVPEPESLVDAVRLTDAKYALALFKKISETPLENFQSVVVCNTYWVTVYLGSSVKTVCLEYSTSDDIAQSVVSEIIDIIENVIEDIPQPSSTPVPPSPTPLIQVTNTPSPSPTWVPGTTPTTSPSPWPTNEPDKPFTCDFYDTAGGRKPYTVSGVICSTTPMVGQ